MIKEEKIFRFYIFDKLLKKSMSELNASETHGMIIASICVNNSEAMLEDFILNFLGVQQNQKIITSFIKKLRESNEKLRKTDEKLKKNRRTKLRKPTKNAGKPAKNRGKPTKN